MHAPGGSRMEISLIDGDVKAEIEDMPTDETWLSSPQWAECLAFAREMRKPLPSDWQCHKSRPISQLESLSMVSLPGFRKRHHEKTRRYCPARA